VERVVVEVGDRGMGGAAQVVRDVAGAGDADEHVLVGARSHAEVNLAVGVGVEHGRGAAEVDVEVLRAQRGGARLEVLGAGREVAVVVLLAIGPEGGAAADEKAEGDEAEQAAGDQRGDAAA
jgi:hypothetical protein